MNRGSWIAVHTVIFVLVACGGGGGGGGSSGGGGSAPVPVTYSGNTSQATLNGNNAKSLLNVVIGSSSASSSLGSIAPTATVVTVADSGGNPKAPNAVFVPRQVVARVIPALDTLRAGRLRVSAMVFDGMLTMCQDAGIVSLSGEINDNTGLGDVTANFMGCNDGDGPLDGVVTFHVRGFDVARGVETDVQLDIPALRVRDPVLDVTVSGTIGTQFDPATSTETQASNIAIRDNRLSRTSKLESLVLSTTPNLPSSGNVQLTITSGRVFDAIEGYVEVSTTNPFVFRNPFDEFPISGGPLVLVGSNGSRVNATAVLPDAFSSSVRLDLDANGDGQIDDFVISAWDRLDGTLASGLRLLELDTNDLAFDPLRNLIYGSIGAAAANHPNSVAVIDPTTGAITNYVPVSTDPRQLAISADSQYLYFAFDGGKSVGRLNLATMTVIDSFVLGVDPTFTTDFTVRDMKVLPDDRNAVAIARAVSNLAGGVAIYDSGVVRAKTGVPTGLGSGVIEFGASSARIYGYDNISTEGGFRRMSVDSTGVVNISENTSLIPSPGGVIKYDNGVLYTGRGQAINPETETVIGNFTFSFFDPAAARIHPDSAHGVVYYLRMDSFSWKLEAHSTSTFTKLGSFAVPGHVPCCGASVDSLVPYGTNGLAFRALDTRLGGNPPRVYLVTADQIR